MVQSRTQKLAEDAGMSIQRYLQILLKRKWLILAVLVVVFGVDAVWTFSRTRYYRASATVIVDQKAPQVLGAQVSEVVDLTSGAFFRAKEYMETQRRVITSLTLARSVAARLSLAADPTFWGIYQGRSGRSFKRTVEDAAMALTNLVNANTVRDSNIIEIAALHTDPRTAARLANAVAQAYMDQNIEYKLTSTTGAVKQLADQLDDLKKKLEESDFALYEFKKKHDIIAFSPEDKQNTVAQKINRITENLTDIRMRRIAIDAQRKQILASLEQNADRDPLKMAVAPILESSAVQRLKEELAKEQQKYVALSEKYLDRHPQVLEQKAKLEICRRALKQEVHNILAALESKHREIRDNETQIAAELQQARTDAHQLDKLEVEYVRLKRAQEYNVRVYGMVLARMKESDLSSQIRANNIRALDAATVPYIPVRPRVRMNLIMGALLGLLLGIGLAFLVDMLDNSIKSQEDVDQVPELVFLGLMPRIPGSATGRHGHRPDPKPELDLIVHRNPKSPVAESCRAIRTNVLFASADRAMKVMGVTSAGPTEGKTTTTVSLAIAMAQAGSRVVVVDTDMRRPRLHRIFGVPGSDGITSVLLGNGKLDEVIKTTEVPDLYVLPCGPIPPNPAELCQGERFRKVLAELAERFDRVILDSPPVMVVTDAVVLSTIVDGMLLVARTGQTTRGSLRQTTRLLTDVGARILGCVLNDMDAEKRGYGYRYRRGYYRYGYGYRYGHYGDKEEAAG